MKFVSVSFILPLLFMRNAPLTARTAMAQAQHFYFEKTLRKACGNLGKSLILQCLQSEAVPVVGSLTELSDACHALARNILQHVDKRIQEEGRITQKTILSLACRKLAELIKYQCPRGEGDFNRTWEALESILSEPALTTKLAEIINSRELVECVCSRHELGLCTVLLAACHWLVTDLKSLFLCEEVWSNLFCKQGFVQHAVYSQMRILLNTVIFQITLETQLQVPEYRDSRDNAFGHQKKELKGSPKGQSRALRVNEPAEVTTNHLVKGQKEHQTSKHQRTKGNAKNVHSARSLVTVVGYEELRVGMVINDRASKISYIIELRNDPTALECQAATKKLWCILTQPVEELCNEKACYLLTIGRHQIHELGLCAHGKDGDAKFLSDVTVSRIGNPIWPKDKSVIKRWFVYSEDQRREEVGDQGNKCLQIWRVGSQRLENRLFRRSREANKDTESSRSGSDITHNQSTEMKSHSFLRFLKKNRYI